MRYLNLLLFLAVSSLYAQGKNSHFITRPALQTGAIFQRWTSGSDHQLEEIVVPLVIHYPVSERFSVSVLNTPTRAQYRKAATSSSIMAFTDTRIATALVLGEERALLNLGANIPSGPAEFDPSKELAVAQQITTHALAMTTTYFGGGLEVSSNIAAAIEAGNWILGASVGGVYKGSYVPVAGATKYRPGPEISVAIGFDRPFGERSRIFGDMGYTWYGKDQSNGQKVFQADGKINFSLAGMWANEVWKASFLLENRFKRKSPYALNKSLSVSYGNEFDFSTEVARQMSRDHALLAVTDLRIYGKNAAGVGEATVVSLGPGWRGRMAAPWQLEAIARFSAGRLNENTIRGIELEIGMVFQL